MAAPDAAAQIVRELHQSAQADLGYNGVPNVQVTVVQDTFRSYTAKVVLSSSQRRKELLLKILRRGATQAAAQSLAVSEYRTLQAAEQLFAAEPRLSAPKPIRLFEHHAAFVMEFATGQPVTRMFSHALRGFLSSRRFAACIQAATDCALWLAMFHALPIDQASPQELFASQVSSLHARLKLAEARGLLNEHTIGRLRERFAAEHCDPTAQPIGLAHHDFGPHNILTTPAGICVLDLGDAQAQCILHDVARFALEIDILSSGWSLFDRRAQYRQLRDAFLAAYGVSAEDPRLELFTVNCALALLLTALPKGSTSTGVPKWHRHLGNYLISRLTLAA
jgi:aminoglycoside phosphotransferase (APT) family kinase protein